MGEQVLGVDVGGTYTDFLIVDPDDSGFPRRQGVDDAR